MRKGRDPLWQPNTENPGPGMYNSSRADSITKKRVTNGIINKEPEFKYVKPREHSPEPGDYQNNLLDFGKDAKNITCFHTE